jgi:hypothetical protein
LAPFLQCISPSFHLSCLICLLSTCSFYSIFLLGCVPY